MDSLIRPRPTAWIAMALLALMTVVATGCTGASPTSASVSGGAGASQGAKADDPKPAGPQVTKPAGGDNGGDNANKDSNNGGNKADNGGGNNANNNNNGGGNNSGGSQNTSSSSSSGPLWLWVLLAFVIGAGIVAMVSARRQYRSRPDEDVVYETAPQPPAQPTDPPGTVHETTTTTMSTSHTATATPLPPVQVEVHDANDPREQGYPDQTNRQ